MSGDRSTSRPIQSTPAIHPRGLHQSRLGVRRRQCGIRRHGKSVSRRPHYWIPHLIVARLLPPSKCWRASSRQRTDCCRCRHIPLRLPLVRP
ncbi:hypothetical protein M3J09_012525 [Ascochyta lentis]